MHYSDNPAMVRVDFFKDSGKWYTTEEMKWDRYRTNEKDGSYEDIVETFKRCLREQFKGHYQGMIAICLEPYHEHAHPLMVRRWEE